MIGTTIPPFEHAIFRDPFFDGFYSPDKEKVRQEINAWVKSGVVSVRDFTLRKTVKVRAGHKYLARAPKRRGR